MDDVYLFCPTFENDNFRIRLITESDCNELLKVYSDKQSVLLFNSDNCNGDDFHYTTIERMKEAIDFWIFSYQNEYFVRLTIIDKKCNRPIGTIELFHRTANDYFNNCGILRLDLKSEYEKKDVIIEIISLIINTTYELFHCDKIATKIVFLGSERIKAFEDMKFIRSMHNIVGNDGTIYNSYYECIKDNS